MSKSTTLDPAQQAALNESAARVLGLRQIDVETVNARPISFAEVDALAHGAPAVFDGFYEDEAGLLSPATFTAEPQRSRRDEAIPHEPVFATMPNPRPGGAEVVADRDATVGYLVKASVETIYRLSTSVALYTSAEAEESARVLKNLASGRARVHVADPNADPKPLMPTYGSMVTVSAIVADIDPEDLATRVQAVLKAEFGDALRTNMKVRSTAVRNRRVDAFTAVGRTPLAIGILDAEVSLVMERSGGGVSTETHKVGTEIVIGE